FHQLRQIGLSEVMRPHPRVKFLQAEINRVRTVLDGSLRALPISRRREQLRDAMGARLRGRRRLLCDSGWGAIHRRIQLIFERGGAQEGAWPPTRIFEFRS